ncbi:serine/threonine-protein kinase [Actinomycetospora chiangmaiensis]|uniref:serine/threonine-protein kinase n=1 Tax=Actinomycetospora chiangmaiensis TaxID=402650 RepID=UPI00039C8275|nr:serine/threonine-protein kinase [Actinomycetospora chiangmaiensis]
MGFEFYAGPDVEPDKYRLVRLEGRGGEATLWRAEVDLAGVPETVAVKVCHPGGSADLDQTSRRWAEQAELLRFLTHPGVVGVREHFVGAPPHARSDRGERGPAGVADRALYLVMNWVPGLPLRDWMLLHPGREGTVAGLRLLEEVANVLEMMHAGLATPSGRAVVHGDLSPGNVIADDVGRATLVDFGLVRLSSHETLTPAGTPGFAAPEVWSDGEYTPAGDRYSFAALGYFVLLGAPPPATAEDLAAALFAHPFLAHTPEEDRHLVLAGFSRDPELRPGPTEWLRRLRGAASTAARTLVEAGPSGGGARGVGGTDRERTAPTGSRGSRAGEPAATARERSENRTRRVRTRLAPCRNGPGELVYLALVSGEWDVEREWWTPESSRRRYHVKLRDRLSPNWIAVEMQLHHESSRLVWANGAGGYMTECVQELARWLILT